MLCDLIPANLILFFFFFSPGNKNPNEHAPVFIPPIPDDYLSFKTDTMGANDAVLLPEAIAPVAVQAVQEQLASMPPPPLPNKRPLFSLSTIPERMQPRSGL